MKLDYKLWRIRIFIIRMKELIFASQVQKILPRSPSFVAAPLCLCYEHQFSLAASPLDLCTLIALHALVIIHMVQANMLQADTRVTPCSQPMCAGGVRSSVTHGTGTVTDIPDQPYDLYIYRCRAVTLVPRRHRCHLLHRRQQHHKLMRMSCQMTWSLQLLNGRRHTAGRHRHSAVSAAQSCAAAEWPYWSSLSALRDSRQMKSSAGKHMHN